MKKVTPKLILTFLLLAFVSCKSPAERGINALHLPDMDLLFEDYHLLDSTKNYTAFAKKLVDANEDLQSSEMYLEAAFMYQLAGQPEEIAPLIHRAIDRGMANPKVLTKFQDLKVDKSSEEWKSLQLRLDSIQNRVKDISHFGLEMDSMERFWEYFERARKDSANAKRILKEFIFEGPRELRDFYVVRYSSVDNMYGQMINAAPAYYTYLRAQFKADSLNALKSKTTAWMKNFQTMYPQAVFPKVYVVPGILNSGGTATEMGLFVGGDMYGKSDTMPTLELNDWQKGAIMKFSDLPELIIHELMHFQQNYKDKANTNNVLSGVINEGVCELLVELCSGRPLRNENLRFMADSVNQKRIMRDLKTELFSDDLSKWLYNGGSIEDRPHDLGYAVGYLIAKSYYSHQEDKKEAVYELLNTDNFENIVAESDFAYLLN